MGEMPEISSKDNLPTNPAALSMEQMIARAQESVAVAMQRRQRYNPLELTDGRVGGDVSLVETDFEHQLLAQEHLRDL